MAEFDDKLNSILSNPDAMAQIMQLAQSLSGGSEGGGTAGASPPPQPGGPSAGPGPQQTPPPSGGDPLSALAGGLDPQDSNARQLLYALRPYLKPERQEKVERALQLARLFRIGKKFLSGREG